MWRRRWRCSNGSNAQKAPKIIHTSALSARSPPRSVSSSFASSILLDSLLDLLFGSRRRCHRRCTRMTNTKCLLLLTLLLLISSSVCQALTSDHHNGADQQEQIQEHEEQLGGKLVDEELDEEDLSDLDDLAEYDEEGAGGGSFETLSSFPTSGGANLVVNVNEGSTGRVIQEHEHVLLLGFAPWCVQSQALLPEFAAAAGLFAEHGSGVVFAKLDAINNPNVASQYNIRGFPTILFFTNGSRAEYSGGNSREEIVIWVQKRTGFAAATITSKDEAQLFLSKDMTAVVGYFDKFEGPEYDAFIAAAKSEDGTQFVQTTSAEVLQLFMSPPFVGVYKPKPDSFSAFGGSFNKAELSTFVELNKHPLVTLLNSKNAAKVYASPLNFHILLFADDEDYENVENLFVDAAKEFKNKAIFLVVDLQDEDFAQPMLGVYGSDTKRPSVAGFKNDDGSRYLMEGDVTAENIKAFAAGFVAGNQPKHFKSEPIPVENEDLVKIVVGKTFDSIVLDGAKDVFLQVHAPWCATCEKVDQVFGKLAHRLQAAPSLVFAKYDGSKNEHPVLEEVFNYPSLLLFPAGSSTSIPAPDSSHKSLKKLSQFLKENVAIPFTLTKGGKVVSEATHKMEVKHVEDFSSENSDMKAKGTESLSVEPSIPLDADVADEVLKNYNAAQEMDSAVPQFDGNMESLYAGDLERKDEL